MPLGSSHSLKEVRSSMLSKILWLLVVLGAFGVTVSVVQESRDGNLLLPSFYFLVYALIIFVSVKTNLAYTLRALTYLLVSYGLTLSEFFFFGVTGLSYVFMLSMVIFGGLLFGFRAGVGAIALLVVSITIAYWWFRNEFLLNNGAELFATDAVFNWFSGIVVFVSFSMMTLTALTMVLNLLEKSLKDKTQLVDDLQLEIVKSTESKSALAVSEGQYRALFERSNDAVFLIEKDSGRYIDANHSAQLLTGLSLKELQKLSVNELSPATALAIINSGSPRNIAIELGEITYPCRGGSDRLALVQCTPVNDDLAFIIAHDISMRKALEQQYSHAQKMEAVGQLAGGIAHDFNNSLQIIMGYGEIALHKIQRNMDAQSDLEAMFVAGARTRRLVSHLLAFRRRQVQELSDIELSSSVKNLLTFVSRTLGEHIHLQYLPSAENGMVRADITQLEQLLMNLCINARDAMNDKGKLTIKVMNQTLNKQFCALHPWAKVGQYISLSVTDDGAGMTPQVQARMFEPFYTTKSEEKGTGLGLSTVFGIVRQHNGLIDVSSRLGEGTSITIYLPRIIADHNKGEIVDINEDADCESAEDKQAENNSKLLNFPSHFIQK